MPLIECIPNVSEGRDLARVQRFADALQKVPGVRLLDHSSDPTHHRSVFTFVGQPKDVEAGVMALAESTVREIDLRTHVGAHPRVGALDVVPFVPVGDTSMADCVAVAERTADRLGQAFDLPIFLYQHASRVPERARLEQIRAGGLAGLSARMREPAWRPDAGPAHLHPTAGATVVGARGPLIAWNLNLSTDDVEVARAIARDVRESSGGLRGVKAVGLALSHRGVAQVSMNVTDYEATPMHVVFARVAAGAARHGAHIGDSEVIGLVPRAALAAARFHLPDLWRWHADRVLEDRIAGL